jgi:hypothetical protein
MFPLGGIFELGPLAEKWYGMVGLDAGKGDEKK